MKIGCIAIGFLVITAASYPQWVLQQSNTYNNLFGVCMINTNTGFVAGDYQTIRKTTNGGLNWSTVSCPNMDYGCISFLNANTGIIAGGPGNLMIQTYNGGANWTVRFPLDEPGKVQYLDSMVIYASASYGVIKSTDGGISWFYIDTTNFYAHFRSLYFVNRDTGTVVGAHATVRTTTDGGTTWTTRIVGLPVQFGDSTLYDVIYTNALTGYISGNNGIVIKTTNGGVNWIYEPIGSYWSLVGLYFTDSNNGTVVGYPYIGRTTNGGVNWISQPYPPNPSQEPLGAVWFVNTYTGWIVGFNGTILYTSNGGLTWANPISRNVPSEFKLEQNYPNPFNPTTNIKFDVPKSSYVTFRIYDLVGREVTTLVNEEYKTPGTYEIEWDASKYASGVYLYTLNTKELTLTKKMVLMK